MNKILQINHKDANEKFPDVPTSTDSLFTDITEKTKVDFEHKETFFFDYGFQPLIPQKYSQEGPFISIGDLNGDGAPDIALTDAQGVKLLMHTGAVGSTTYAAPVSIFTQTANSRVFGANIIAIADLNGDGFNDLVITDPGPGNGGAPTVSVLLQDATHPGTFLAPVSYATAPYSLATSIVVTDVNGDGFPDIIIGGTTATSVLLQNPASRGTFNAASNYATPDANEIAVADVNGDGKPDIVVGTGPAQTVTNGVAPNVPGVLLQNASSPGTFGALQTLP